jgi:Cu(I)/Ag(I) efflux system membrane protein CusA/SilA
VIERLIAGCVRRPWFTLAAVLAAGAWGVYSLRHTPLDAIPDLSDTQVILTASWPGRSPDLVEAQITYPIVTALLGAPRVRYVRGQSMVSDSFVYVVFEDGTDIYWARSRVLEYMSSVQNRLPEGVTPSLGPDATSVGWVFEYVLVDTTGQSSLADLRSFQDWSLRYWLTSIEGVAEVASVGGFVRQYQVDLDPERLLAYDVAATEVREAIRRSNRDAGGGVVEIGEHEHFVRVLGYLRSVEDVEAVVVKSDRRGVPVTVAQLGEVRRGPASRRGIAEWNGRGEVVGGIVVMRDGENALAVVDRVKARLAEVEHSLPPGVHIEVAYDRSELIRRAVETLWHELLQEMIVVSLVILIFLMHAPSALIPIVGLPIAVLLAFIPMVQQGLTANIMSLGGIAVAIGAMVDASIILVENANRRLSRWEAGGEGGTRLEVVTASLQEVGRSIFFALLVLTVSFLPVFALTGSEGKLFRPLAFTKTYSMAFAALLAVTLTPALAALVLRGRFRTEEEHPLNRWLVRIYEPAVRFVVRRRRLVFAVALLLMASSLPAFLALESEFMPPLNEGSLLYMPTAPPGIAETQAVEILQSMDRRLAAFPEVQSVFGKMGRAETATDPAPLSMVETVITLRPESAWRPGVTWESLVQEMDAALRYPGMPNIWWMPIQTRLEMLATGVRSALGIKVYGDDLAEIERLGVEIEGALAGVRGTRSAYAERVTGGYYLDFEIDRRQAARYGVRVDEIAEIVESAIGGTPVTETVEGRERYTVAVRYARELRDDPEELERVVVPTPSGGQVPLGELAELSFRHGPSMILEEEGQLFGLVSVDVANRSLVDYVADAKGTIAERVQLPPGYRIDFSGQFKYFERARARLLVLVPVSLLLVALLLYWSTRSWAETAIVLLAVPFSLIGAVWLLFLLGFKLSVAVWVGLIALAGLDAETGVVMLLYLRLAHRDRVARGMLRTPADLEDAIVEGAAHRIRPKMMTVLAVFVGLLPILLGTGTGADVMKRIAAPMAGGVVTSFVLELLVYPAVFAAWKGRHLTPGPAPLEPGHSAA